MAETEQRPLRMCDSCGGVDDHPRHVFAHADGEGKTSDEVADKALDSARELGSDQFKEILRQVRDNATIQKHMDCCRNDGCPDGTCDEVTKGAEDKSGADLVKHLTRKQ